GILCIPWKNNRGCLQQRNKKNKCNGGCPCVVYDGPAKTHLGPSVEEMCRNCKKDKDQADL
ncbi:hypothetical protein KI387_003549, partial [Taxus chinensis]